MKTWRGVLLAGSLLFIAIATLTPGAAVGLSSARTDFFCLACGPEGGADVTLNIALFIPLGVSLALLRVSPQRALLMGALLSIAIETAQHIGIPAGRIASLSDLLTNTAGAALGATIAWQYRAWLQPTQSTARRLAHGSAIVVAAFLGFTGWALGTEPKASDATASSQLTLNKGANASGYGWFQGVVSTARINGFEFTQHGNGPLMVFGHTAAPLHGVMDIVGRDERKDFVPFVGLNSVPSGASYVMAGQRSVNAELRVRLRGSLLRLTAPTLPLLNAFASVRASDRIIGFDVTTARWSLSANDGTATLHADLPISLSLGWTLFQTVVHVGDRMARVVTLLWLLMLWLPVGYWYGRATPSLGDTLHHRGRGNIRRWRFVTNGVAALVLTLLLVPRLTGISATLPYEWALSLAGFSLGVIFATRFYHYIPSQ